MRLRLGCVVVPLVAALAFCPFAWPLGSATPVPSSHAEGLLMGGPDSTLQHEQVEVAGIEPTSFGFFRRDFSERSRRL